MLNRFKLIQYNIRWTTLINLNSDDHQQVSVAL